ncbi:MAG: NAD-dependent epimerase/dehydratase family protein [Planctomycetota bacterium]
MDHAILDRPALVTGATGYVAGWIVRRLLERGATVHAAVRDPANADKRAHLDAMARELPGSIRYFAADLLEPGSYADAMAGCGVVFHAASPFFLGVDDPKRDLVDPAVEGTRSVLAQADATPTVDRIVLTSSCAAIYGDNIDLRDAAGGVFTEDDWNTTSSLDHQPYSYSKTLAEREAWRIAGEQDRWRLVAINPSFVLGPATNPHAGAESIAFLTHMGDGTLRIGVPDMGMGVVDVRDVADAHLAAATRPDARGRHIVSGHDSGLRQIADILRAHFGSDHPIPSRSLPRWLVWLVGPVADGRLTRRAIARNVGYPWRGENAKSRRELGIEYRPLEDTLTEMFEQLVDAGVL